MTNQSCLTLRASRAGESVRIEVISPNGTAIGSDAVTAPSNPNSKVRAAQRVLQRIRHHAGGNREDVGDLRAVMDELTQQIVPSSVQRLLADAGDEHIVLAIDQLLSDIPWELLRVGEAYLCQQLAISRMPYGAMFSCGGQPNTDATIQLGVVANPEFSLPGTVREADLLTGIIRQQYAITTTPHLHFVSQEQLTAVMEESDWLHYAGHATRSDSGEVGWLLADGRFGVREIEGSRASRWPRFIFAHACDSARDGDDHLGGMARAFLAAGVDHFLGTIVPILDEPCRAFTRAFYESLLRHESIGIAVRTARQTLQHSDSGSSLLWATYVLYGDPTTVLLPLRDESASSGAITSELEFPIPCADCGRPIRSRHGIARSPSGEQDVRRICRICARKQSESSIRPPPAVR